MIKLGRHSYIGTYKIASRNGGEVEVGNFTSIGDNIYFHGTDNHRLDLITVFPVNRRLGWSEFPDSLTTKGDIIIGNDVWIGDNVEILSGSTIGDGCVVGAGSVVAGRLKAFGIYAGNPARLIRYRFDRKTIADLKRLEWWKCEDEAIRAFFDEWIKKYKGSGENGKKV